MAARWGLYKSVRSATVVRPRAQVAMALVLAERHLDAALRRPTDAAAVAVFVAFARMLYSFRETFSFLPSPSRQRRDGRLWCWNVEDAEEVTADNVSLITVSCVVEVQVGS